MNKYFIGDCREEMKKLIADGVKVQTCVTSPPYWGLRDYGTATWEGGSPECNHKYTVISPYNNNFNERWGNSPGQRKQEKERHEVSYKDICGKCGAKRIDNQLGLEKTPEEYVANMVEVFRLVRELLADDGTLWLNLGDSYAGSGCGTNDYRTEASRSINKSDVMFNKKPPQQRLGRQGKTSAVSICERGRGYYHSDFLKPKDLIGIPWRVAFALQADGWYLRSDIIWHKPNPMPESVKDRPTKSHEYIFLLTKNAKYYYDAKAIQEPIDYLNRAFSENHLEIRKDKDNEQYAISSKSQDKYYKKLKEFIENGNPMGRNKRSVWTINTHPYKKAHFATFPTKLIEPCILAGSRVGDIVFDPFFGSGTVGEVASNLGRQWIGIELNPDYEKLQIERTAEIGMAFNYEE